jgi:hypothetical protein
LAWPGRKTRGRPAPGPAPVDIALPPRGRQASYRKTARLERAPRPTRRHARSSGLALLRPSGHGSGRPFPKEPAGVPGHESFRGGCASADGASRTRAAVRTPGPVRPLRAPVSGQYNGRGVKGSGQGEVASDQRDRGKLAGLIGRKCCDSHRRWKSVQRHRRAVAGRAGLAGRPRHRKGWRWVGPAGFRGDRRPVSLH